MPFCPSCRSEYRAGFTVCKPCGDVELVEELPKTEELRAEDLEETRPVGFATSGEISRPVELEAGRTIDLLRVYLLHQASEIEKTLIEGGIAAIIVPVSAPFMDDHQRFEVRVRRELHEEAEALLREAFAGAVAQEEGELDVEGAEADADKCPACGAHVPLDVEECPECGLNVGTA